MRWNHGVTRCARLANSPFGEDAVVLEVAAVGDAEAHVRRLRGDAQRGQQALEVRVVAVVEDDEAGVHVMRGVLGVDADGVRVAARERAGLEHGDLVLAVQQVRGGQPGDAGADDRDPHRLLSSRDDPVSDHLMRQLSSLDAQFLNVESARIYGHVAFLGIYDPSTAPGGELGGPEVKTLLEQRLHLLPPLRWRLVEVPLGLDLPYWVDDPDFDLDFHVRETGDARRRATTASSPRPSQRLFARPLDRGRPLWEIYVIHGLARRARRAADQDPPLGRRRHLAATRSWPCCSTPSPTGARDRPRAGNGPARARSRATARCSCAACAASRASRCARCARCRRTVAGFTDLPGANALPGVPTLSHVYSRRAPDVRLRREHGRARGDQGAAAEDAASTGRSPRTAGSRSARCRSTPCARSGASSA